MAHELILKANDKRCSKFVFFVKRTTIGINAQKLLL